MRVAEGFVVAEQDVPGVHTPGDTAEVRTTIDASRGCERLEQHVIRFSPGRSLERAAGDRQEGLFVGSGKATRELEGQEHVREPWTAAFVAPGETYRIATDEELVVASVTAPASERGIGEP